MAETNISGVKTNELPAVVSVTDQHLFMVADKTTGFAYKATEEQVKEAIAVNTDFKTAVPTTVPVTPSDGTVYLPMVSGTYTNFKDQANASLVVADTDAFPYFLYNGTYWTKRTSAADLTLYATDAELAAVGTSVTKVENQQKKFRFFTDDLPNNFFKELHLYGKTSLYTNYRVTQIKNNVGTTNPYNITITAFNGTADINVCAWISNSGPNYNIVMKEYNNSGVMGVAVVDWSSIAEATYLTPYPINNKYAFASYSPFAALQKFDLDIADTPGTKFTISEFSLSKTNYNLVPVVNARTTEPLSIPDDGIIICKGIYNFAATNFGIMFYDADGTPHPPTTYSPAGLYFTFDVSTTAYKYYRLSGQKDEKPTIFHKITKPKSKPDLIQSIILGNEDTYKQLIETGTYTIPAPLFEYYKNLYNATTGALSSSGVASTRKIYVHLANKISYQSFKASTVGMSFYDKNMTLISSVIDNVSPTGTVKEALIPDNAYWAFHPYSTLDDAIAKGFPAFDKITLKKNKFLSSSGTPEGATLEYMYKVSENVLGTLANVTMLVDTNVNLNSGTMILDNVELVFVKGIKLTNGTLSGSYNISTSDYQQVFDIPGGSSVGVSLAGKCKNKYLSVQWWGAKGTSAYIKDAVYTALYGQGVDDTPPINWALLQAKNLGGASVFVPPTNGAYWVRCQTKYANQHDPSDHGDFNAIDIYDNTELFGDRNFSKLVVVDYQIAADYNALNPIYRTRDLMGFAPWTQAEMDAIGKGSVSKIFFKVGRSNVTVHDLYMDCRVSMHPSSDTEINSIVCCIYSVKFSDEATGTTYGRGKDCIFRDNTCYDVAVACLVKNHNGTGAGYKQVSRTLVMGNIVVKTSNKAFEFSRIDNAVCSHNNVRLAQCCYQAIFDTTNVVFSNNIGSESRDGIDLAQGALDCIVANNIITECDAPFLIRADAGIISTEFITENLYITGNIFEQKAVSVYTYLFAFQGASAHTDTVSGFMHVRNVVIENNNFRGNLAVIGMNTNTQQGGKLAWLVENVTFRNNNWDCNINIQQGITQSGVRPQSVVKDIIFEDVIKAGRSLSVLGNTGRITFANKKIVGTVSVDGTGKGAIVFTQSEISGVLAVPAGNILLFFDTLVIPGSSIDVTGATIQVDRRYSLA